VERVVAWFYQYGEEADGDADEDSDDDDDSYDDPLADFRRRFCGGYAEKTWHWWHSSRSESNEALDCTLRMLWLSP